MDLSHREMIMAVLTCLISAGTDASKSAERLYDKLMTNYSSLYRPVVNDTDKVVVYLGLDLSQLVDINEQNEFMVTSVWINQQWKDYKLVWDPFDYEGIEYLTLQIDQIWSPDIVLYNTAVGNYVTEIINRATVRFDGTVKWSPPANFKSSCNIDIAYFPFDVQTCYMKFGAWTHDGSVMELLPLKDQVGRKDYRENGEWEIQDNPVKRYEEKYACCEEIYIDIKFYFVLKRNAQFYVVTLVIPCILITFLTLSVFYISSDAQEKITLSISVMLTLVVFLLLIPSIVPPTSKTLPLIVKYMVFTMSIVALSILSTVVTINLHFRTSLNHKMPEWLRRVFLQLLPKLLLMERPKVIEERKQKYLKRSLERDVGNEHDVHFSILATMDEGTSVGIRSNYKTEFYKTNVTSTEESKVDEIAGRSAGFSKIPLMPTIIEPSDDVSVPKLPTHSMFREMARDANDIVKILKDSCDGQQMEEEWAYVGLVIDRLLLYLFSISIIVGTIYVFIQPSLSQGVDSISEGTSVTRESTNVGQRNYNGSQGVRETIPEAM